MHITARITFIHQLSNSDLNSWPMDKKIVLGLVLLFKSRRLWKREQNLKSIETRYSIVHQKQTNILLTSDNVDPVVGPVT